MDSDDRLIFKKGASFAGAAWQEGAKLEKISGDPSKIIWDEPSHGEVRNPRRQRYVHKLVWVETDWMLSVPALGTLPPEEGSGDWVVVIDSNIALEKFRFYQDKSQEEKLFKTIARLARLLPYLDKVARARADALNKTMQGLP